MGLSVSSQLRESWNCINVQCLCNCSCNSWRINENYHEYDPFLKTTPIPLSPCSEHAFLWCSFKSPIPQPDNQFVVNQKFEYSFYELDCKSYFVDCGCSCICSRMLCSELVVQTKPVFFHFSWMHHNLTCQKLNLNKHIGLCQNNCKKMDVWCETKLRIRSCNGGWNELTICGHSTCLHCCRTTGSRMFWYIVNIRDNKVHLNIYPFEQLQDLSLKVKLPMCQWVRYCKERTKPVARHHTSISVK